jgi:TonB-linked SusC/RagA family outer membrane protein
MKIRLLLFLFVSSTLTMYSQQNQVTGTVLSSEDNLPIVGANVLLKGQNSGTSTDFDGNYQISAEKGAVLIFSYIGFETQEVILADQKSIQIVLAPNTAALEEIVVVGYGTQRKKEVTGAVAVVDSEAIEKLNPTRVEQALQGQISGVNITSASGSPGSGANIRIRGISTNGDNRPLILVDGNVIEDLSVINPNDIKSVNVLKDATAGIYGVRAANGVILIVTKSGRKNSELKFTVDSYYGFQQTSKEIDLMGPRDFAMYVNDASGKTKFTVYPETGTDWQKEVFQTAPMLSTNVSASGGTEKSAYSFGVSYLDQEGIVGLDKSAYNRLTSRLSYQYDLTKDLKISSTAIYTHSEKNNLPENGIGAVLYNAVNLNPDLSVYDTNGEYSLVKDIKQIEIINPLAQIPNTYNTGNVDKISATFGVDYSFLEKFKFSSKFQMNHAVVLDDVFLPNAYYGPGKGNNRSTNEVIDLGAVFDDYTWDNYITYTNTFNEDHNLNILLGTSVFNTEGRYYGNFGRGLKDGSNSIDDAKIENIEGFDLDGLASINISPRFQDVDIALGKNVFQSRLASYFTRFQYNYKGKYLLSGVVRRDGSSKFGPENKFGFFPSGSIGWNVSEEDFLKDSSWLSSLKLRGSYGIIGNDRIRDFVFISRLDGEAVYSRNDEESEGDLLRGVAEGGLSNPEVRWEKQKTANVGFDAAFFQNKLNITVDAYTKETEDLLIAPQVSGILGASAPGSGAPFVNAGTVQNRGLEFRVAYADNIGEDFKFNTSFNISTNENEVLFVESANGFQQGGDFGVGLGIITSRMEAGHPLGYFYGYQTDGLYQNQAEIDLLDAGAFDEDGLEIPYHSGAEPGDLKFVDINGDGKISEEDKTNIGDPIADMTFGFNLGFTYKNIDFSSSAFASIGNDMVRDYERKDTYANRGTYMLDRWTGEGTSNTVPRATSGKSINTDNFSDFYVEDASYLRIQNVQIGYTFNEDTIAAIGMQKVRIYLSANNLHTFTNYKGYDPSASSGSPIGAGIDKGFYPVAKTYMLGLNLKF